MYKQSPSRNQRSKGIKVKHVLQICLLLAVCFWLVYQVKHSHEKRKEFDVKDEKIVGRVQTNGETQRFGRKDLPRTADVATDVEKHGEDEEEKESLEEEEESKHVEDEPERDDSGAGEREEEEDSGRGGGDDEIDENETERTKTDHELEEELLNEEKDREEHEGTSEENHNENEENEGVREDHSESEENEDAGKEDHSEPEENDDVKREDQTENDATSDDQDHDGARENTHEAREENYKADDASSEVAHDIQSVIPETENATTGQTNEMFGKVNFGQENETKPSDKDDALIQSGVQPREEDKSRDVTTTNITVTEQIKRETKMTKSGDGSLQNSTLPSLPIDHTEKSTNSSAAVGEGSALLSNGTQSGSNLSQNSTGEGASGHEEPNLQSHTLENANQTKLAVDDKTRLETTAGSNKTEDVNTDAGESRSSSNTTLDLHHTSNSTDTVAAKEDSSLHQEGEKSLEDHTESDGTTVSDEVSEDQSADEGVDGVQHDPIDESDNSLTQEEKESRTDLDTLPDITSEVQTTEDAAAE